MKISITELRKLLATNAQQGTAIKSLKNLEPILSVQLGKITSFVECGQYVPFIAYLSTSHAIVVWEYAAEGGYFVVGDPGIGLIEMRQEDLFRQWNGIAAILRPPTNSDLTQPLLQKKQSIREKISNHEIWQTGFKLKPMLLISLTGTLLGILNTLYSLYFASYLKEFTQFLLFALSTSLLSIVLNTITNWIQARLGYRYGEQVGSKLQEAFELMDRSFYTMGDVSTRYTDGMSVVGVLMGLFQSVPYSIAVFIGSIYFLAKIGWLLAVFIIAFLALVIVLVTPMVGKIQRLMYTLKIRQTLMTNVLKESLVSGQGDLMGAWMDTLSVSYKQSLWSIPLNTTFGHSSTFPVIFVVIFLYWKSGGTTQYEALLSAIMITGYAVSAGQALYQAFVSWKVSQPSLHRYVDFMGVIRDGASDRQQTNDEDNKIDRKINDVMMNGNVGEAAS